MKSLIRELIKSTISLTVCVAMVTGLMNTKVGLCSDRASQLGSAVAVGSPVLNQNFTTDDWNPYEMECFGVYLSNFVRPMLETYAEAFAEDGEGAYALRMSSKNDPNNNKILKTLTDYAISNQLTNIEPLYISYYESPDVYWTYDDIDSEDKTPDTKVQATLGSLYAYGFLNQITSGDSGIVFMEKDACVDYLNNRDKTHISSYSEHDFPNVTQDIVFYKNVNGAKKVMFDTCSVYDSDALNALLANMYNCDYSWDFYSNYSSLFDEPLGVDSYGNIVVASSGRMVFPACLNTHSTVDGCVNYVNRYMMNHYTANASIETDPLKSDVFSAYVRSPIYTLLKNQYGMFGYPVNYSKSMGSTGMFYASNTDIAMLTDKNPFDCFYTLAVTDYTIGDADVPLRYAMPTAALKEGSWAYLSMHEADLMYHVDDVLGTGYGAGNEHFGLYFMIQANYTRSENGLLATKHYGGYFPPGSVFNEIYLPTENNKTIPMFVSKTDGWEMIDGTLWAASDSHGSVDDNFVTLNEVNNAFINALAQGLRGKTYTGDLSPMNSCVTSYIGNLANIKSEGIDNFATMMDYDGNKPLSSGDNVNIDTMGGPLTENGFWLADTNGSCGDFSGGLYESMLYYYLGGTHFDGIDDGQDFTYGFCFSWDGDPEELCPLDTFYKIYQMDSSGYIGGIGSFMSNGLGNFDDAASYIYVTYLNWYGIGREEDAYGVKTAKSNFDPLFFSSDGILVKNFNDFGAPGVDEEGQEAAARQRVLTLLDTENGAEYRQQLVMNTFSSFLTNAYEKLAGKTLGSERNSTLSLQEVANNPFTAWMEDHSVWILLVFSFLAMICAVWTAIRRGKGFFWIICQITIGITAVVFIPVMLDAGIHFANGVAQKCYASNADIWWLSDAVQSRQAELGLYEIYAENESAYSEAGLTMNVMSNIVLGSEAYQSVKFSQDISNKHTMKLTGLYASLSQYPSAAWILPTLLDESTVGDETTGYSVRVGAYKKLSELETLYWGYTGPVGVGDTDTMLLLSGPSLYPLTAANNKQTLSDVGVTGVDGNVWYYKSYGRCVPTDDVLTHTNTTLTGGVEANANFLSSSVWMDDTNSKDKIYSIESLAVDSLSSAGRTPTAFCVFVGEDAPAFKAHEIVKENDEGAWYLTGTESPLAYFYMVMQDTFYNYNTSQTIDAMIGANIIYDDENGEEQYSYNLSFLQATINGSYLPNAAPGQLAIDHHWDGTAVGTEYARDVLDLDYFFRYYAPTMYVASIYTGGSQIGLGNDTAVAGEDIVGHFGSAKVGDFWDYPIYEDNYAAWLYASNWAIKLYENPENIKLQTVRDSSGNKYTVCPINPETYPESRPFVTCAAQMVAQGLNEGDLSTVEYICVQANDEAVRELIKTVNVYTNAPSKLDVNSFKDLLAVKCLTAFANSMNQACLMDSTYRIIPNGFEFDNISFDTVFSQMLYNNYRKAHAYTVENVVKGYLMDEGPIMGTVLIFATLLGTTVIPFVLRIGVAILFVINIWAALNGVSESLETRASVVIASLLNTASFAIRTTILFVVQAFLMSMGSAGLIKAKAEISFKGGATMMIIALCVFYIIYTISIIKFFVTSIQHGSDMGAAYLRANYELARDQGAMAFARHRFAQSMGGKMLNAISKGKLANDVTMPSGGAGAGGQGGGKDDLKQSAGPDSEGSSRKGGSNSNGKKNIDDARDRSNKTLTQAADKLTAKGKDSVSNFAYAKYYERKGAEYAEQQADSKDKEKKKTPDGNEKSKPKSDNSDNESDKKSDKKDDKKDDDKTTKIKI